MNIKLAKLSMWFSVMAINILGLATIYSVTRYSATGIKGSFNNQIKFLVIAIVVTILASMLPARFWKVITPWSYVLTLISLAAVLIIGQKVNGAQSWIRLPGLSIQPSEFLKFSLILVLARTLSTERQHNRLQDLFLGFVLSAIPLLLVLKQPDLGTAMTLIPMIVGLTYLSGYDLPKIGLLIGYGSLGFLLLMISAIQHWEWIPIHSYQLGRIIRLLHQDDWAPLLSVGNISPQIILWSGIILGLAAVCFASSWRKLIWLLLVVGHALPLYQWSTTAEDTRIAVHNEFLKPFKAKNKIEEPQLRAAKHALANGALTGSGWRQGQQTQYQQLPYAYSDLVFAAFAEEWGFLGAIALIALYSLMVGSMFVMAYNIENKFCALCIAGVALMMTAQVFIHVGYTTGILPMTGITLPFMSAGGSALVTTWIGMALVHSCATENVDYF